MDEEDHQLLLPLVEDENDYILLTPMRKTIAERLSKSKREIPHFYLRKKVYVDKLLSARKLLNKKLEIKKIKISINDFIIKAIAHALHNHPKCNVTKDICLSHSAGEQVILKRGDAVCNDKSNNLYETSFPRPL